jgi:hypothetical protein
MDGIAGPVNTAGEMIKERAYALTDNTSLTSKASYKPTSANSVEFEICSRQ